MLKHESYTIFSKVGVKIWNLKVDLCKTYFQSKEIHVNPFTMSRLFV